MDILIARTPELGTSVDVRGLSVDDVSSKDKVAQFVHPKYSMWGYSSLAGHYHIYVDLRFWLAFHMYHHL